MQMVVLEEIYLMIKINSWRQNPRVKSGYSMEKYVRTVYVSNESNKDKRTGFSGVSAGEEFSLLLSQEYVNYLGCSRYILTIAPSCQYSGM